MRKFFTHTSPALAAVLTLSMAFTGICHSQQARVVGQWDILAGGMEAGTNGVTRWVAPQKTVLEFSTNWVVRAGALQNVGGTEVSGLKPEYESSTNLTVRAGVLLVKPNAPNRVRTALFTGHHVARLANFPDGGEEGSWDAVGSAKGVRIFVNGEESAPLQTGWQIVSFIAPSEMPLEKAMVFADPFTAWKRTFEGETKCVILLSGAVSEAALRGMEGALKVRCGVAGIRPATQQERRAAQAISGYNSHGVWRTLFLVK